MLSDFWTRIARKGAISLLKFLRTTGLMESDPAALWSSRFCRSLIIPLAEMRMSRIIYTGAERKNDNIVEYAKFVTIPSS